MKHTGFVIAFIAAPALLAAQQSSAGVSTSARAQARVSVPANYSAEARAKIEAAFEKAHAKQLPDSQMRSRMAEGQAKNASDMKVAAAVQRVEANLETSQALFVRAGKANPKPEEVTSGAQAIERGASHAQIIAAIKNPPANATAAAALDALAQVGPANAATAGSVGAAVSGAVSNVNGRASAGAAVGAAAGAATGVTGVVSGAVGPKKP
jgi:hypothetical protein